ncbi:hypothetical protein M407DRAFT_31484 [Tulasnella calospora MUT 4182]|uniref:Uncharacterized protein n=1 Tax=Tulasnella calospora MUT 4182 TaxID=1051891 RepID=A0A0C3Q5J5_9AGAM|nr:hypothetical protein M407DRAFT_31484 [Tulasnella calospora MUT 4182]
MTTLGSKRPRESDVHDATAISGDVASAAASGVTAAGPSASTRNSKKARTSNTNNATEGEATLPPSASNPAQETADTTQPQDPPAETSGDSAQNVPTGDTTAEAAQQQPTKASSKRSQRRSAMAAKDKIVAAENAADEDEQQQAGKGAVPLHSQLRLGYRMFDTRSDHLPVRLADTALQEAQASKPSSTAPIKSRGRGGDRPAETTPPESASAPSSSPAAIAAVVQTPAAQPPAAAPVPPQPGLTPSGPPHPDPSNPYLVRYGDPNNPYAHIPGMPPPGMMLPHNPYLPPPPAGYPMFPPPGMMAPGAQPYPMMHMQPPPPPPPGFNPAAAAAAASSGEKKDGDSDKEGELEGAEEGEGSDENRPGQPQHPPPPGAAQHAPYGAYAFPPGFAGHMPPPEFVPNPADPNGHHHHPYGHAHLLPPLHHPHPPNTHQPAHLAHPGMQLTLPLAVTDHTLPSHLDAVIRAPESLTITYTEVPEGTYLLRNDFAEGYPKQLEPPRKTTDMRCLFCKRHYSGPNARGMWRRHVTGKHDFVFERKTAAGGHTGGRPRPKTSEHVDSDEDDGPIDGQPGDAANVMAGSAEGPQGPGEMAMVGPDGMMGLLSMNGMPVHPLPPGVGGYPHHGMTPMHILPGTNIPIASIPPHPVAPMSKRRPSGGARPGGGASGVGMGNGGGGLVPRVHPLLTKEERIERARASKRHYAMKRRALEKMKQGGIPKGARLVEGMFILADGTQIPADPNVEYRDLSVAAHHATSYQQASSAAQEEGLGMGDVPKKSKKTKGKGKKVDEDDEDDDAMDATMISMDQDLSHASMEGLVSMEAPAGVSVDMDPWAEQAAVFHAQQVQAQQIGTPTPVTASPTLQQQYQQQQTFGGTKMADIPVVPRGQQQQPELSEVLSSLGPQAIKATRKSPRKGNAVGETDGQAQGEGPADAVKMLPEESGPGPAPTGEDGEERRFCYCNDVEYGSVSKKDDASRFGELALTW